MTGDKTKARKWDPIVTGADTSARRANVHSPAIAGVRLPARWLAAALSAAMLGVYAVLLVPGIALTQTVRPTIVVAATLPAEPANQAPMSIRISPPDAAPKGSFIRIRGLPHTVALSDGHSIAPGSWAVAIGALPNLKITLPPTALGKSEITITLVGSDGSVLAEASSVLVVAAAPANSRGQDKSAPLTVLRAGTPVPAQTERVDPPPAAIPSQDQTKLTPEARERGMRLVKRGDEHLSEGGIAQARLLYERAAEAGLPQGAMALAATYDEAELNRLGVRGLQPDSAIAKRWYERARQLGAAEADQRLRRLGAN